MEQSKMAAKQFFFITYYFLSVGNTLILFFACNCCTDYLYFYVRICVCHTSNNFFFFFSNAGQIIKDAIIQTPITQTVLPAYPNSKVTMKITHTNKVSKFEGSTLTHRVLKLTKREQNKQLRKQARKKGNVTHN